MSKIKLSFTKKRAQFSDNKLLALKASSYINFSICHTNFLVETRGFEPLTSGMQILRSAKLSYAPQIWLRGQDLNLRPLGYEPNELPDCSTPRYAFWWAWVDSNYRPHAYQACSLTN